MALWTWLRVFRSVLFCGLSGMAAVAFAGDPENPPAAGFDLSGSDARAIEIADAVMERMGGRRNWDQTRYLTWRFFGGRMHVWDKWTGDLRFEEEGRVVLMNLRRKEGRVWRAGMEMSDPDSVRKYVQRAYQAWINDSYWLVMPYKLKDSGVTLKYAGEGELADGRDAYVLTLSFEGVGVTPQNKYDVYVGKGTMMVEQWAYYENASDPEPRFETPWAHWERHGRILLSADRGKRKHTDVAVFDTLPASVFESPEAVDMMSLVK